MLNKEKMIALKKYFMQCGFKLSNESFYEKMFLDTYNDEKIKQIKYENDKNGFQFYTSEKRIIVIKSYETIKSAYYGFNIDQQIIYRMINKLKINYRKNIYFLINVNDVYNSKYDILRSIIEKDDYVCKKYVIYGVDDLKRISFLTIYNGQVINFENCEDKIENLFFDLIEEKCINEMSIHLAKKYIYDYRLELEGE